MRQCRRVAQFPARSVRRYASDMVEVTLCADATEGAQLAYGSVNPDAVALVELLDANTSDYRRTMVRLTLVSGREMFIALDGGRLTSDYDEHVRHYREFCRALMQAKSPLAAL